MVIPQKGDGVQEYVKKIAKMMEDNQEKILQDLIDAQGSPVDIGDYVLSGGELGAAVLCDSVIRLIPGVLGNETSALTDSFQDDLLAPPVYTRPQEYKGWEVPSILTSGNFPKIEEWRENQAYERTKRLRPDLLKDD